MVGRLALAAVAVTVTAAVATTPPVVTAKLTASPVLATVTAEIAAGWHINSHTPTDDYLIPTILTVTPPAGMQAGAVEYPTAVTRQLSFGGTKQLALYEGALRFRAPLSGVPAESGQPVRATLRYQACDDERCLPPATLELVAVIIASVPEIGLDDNTVAQSIARFGYGWTLVLVALLGLALNLTPCVYPLISVTIAFFGGRTGENRPRALAHALLYAVGICLTFATLGGSAALTGSLFGAALQRPEVLAALALVMIVLAVSNFGLYQLRMPASVLRFASRGGEGALAALFMGSTMGVVAAPCIGPSVAALLLYVGAKQDVGLGFALFLALGVGLGAPYVVLAAVAQHVRRLPRSGEWLAWMERLFGFLLLGLALFFVTPLLPPAVGRWLTMVLLAVGAAVLGFSPARASGPLGMLRRALVVTVAAAGILAISRSGATSLIGWRPFTAEALTAARGRPVLIDFEAVWCIPCREMDHTTWRDREVLRALEGFATLKADITTQDDAAQALMASWQVVGVPTFVFLDPSGAEQKRLHGYVPAAAMVDALRALSAK